MAKKAVKKVKKASSSRSSKNYTVHHSLEKPVHNLLSYTVLFALALVVLLLVMRMSA